MLGLRGNLHMAMELSDILDIFNLNYYYYQSYFEIIQHVCNQHMA